MRGGKCLSKEYINSQSRLKIQCKEGHTWIAIAYHIKTGSWCPTCFHKQLGLSKRDNLKTYQKIAREHGGKCLSKEYSDKTAYLEFECAEGACVERKSWKCETR